MSEQLDLLWCIRASYLEKHSGSNAHGIIREGWTGLLDIQTKSLADFGIVPDGSQHSNAVSNFLTYFVQKAF
jgi:hypothetical protein